MTERSGYTLDQLLEWCAGDRLIEGYDMSGEGVVIVFDGTRHHLTHRDAKLFLTGIFTGVRRNSGADARPDIEA